MLADFVGLQQQLHGEMAGGLRALAALMMPEAAVALATAFAFGALHALMPGHGKAMLVSYHAGRPTGVAEGLLNSVLLIAAHVGSAILLVAAGVGLIESGSFVRGGTEVRLSALSATLIIAAGAWLFVVAIRGHHHGDRRAGPALALVTGLVPCPLTTFLMSYAMLHGLLTAGLLLSAAMAAGMITTVALFALLAVYARSRLLPWLAKTERSRGVAGRVMEATSALLIMLIGAFTLIRLR